MGTTPLFRRSTVFPTLPTLSPYETAHRAIFVHGRGTLYGYPGMGDRKVSGGIRWCGVRRCRVLICAIPVVYGLGKGGCSHCCRGSREHESDAKQSLLLRG